VCQLQGDQKNSNEYDQHEHAGGARGENIVLLPGNGAVNQPEVHAADKHKEHNDNLNPDIIISSDAQVFCRKPAVATVEKEWQMASKNSFPNSVNRDVSAMIKLKYTVAMIWIICLDLVKKLIFDRSDTSER